MVTRRPWATGLTAITVFVVVDEPSEPRWSAYTHFSPTAMGNSAEPAAAVVSEPPDVVPGGELPDPPEPTVPDPEPEPAEPDEQPATSSAAAARTLAARPARWHLSIHVPFLGCVQRGGWLATHAGKLRPLRPVAAGKAGRPRLVVMSNE